MRPPLHFIQAAFDQFIGNERAMAVYGKRCSARLAGWTQALIGAILALGLGRRRRKNIYEWCNPFDFIGVPRPGPGNYP